MGEHQSAPPCVVWNLYGGWRELKLLVRCLENRESVSGHLEGGGLVCSQGLLKVGEEGRRGHGDSGGKDPACSAGSKDGGKGAQAQGFKEVDSHSPLQPSRRPQPRQCLISVTGNGGLWSYQTQLCFTCYSSNRKLVQTS